MKTFNLPIAIGALALLAYLDAPATAQSQVVFDNTPNLINQTPVFFSAQEYGDELALAGSAREVTEFSFAYFGNFGETTGVFFVLRFYVNDGSDAVAGAGTALRPKSLLWDSGEQSLLNGVNQVTLTIPNVVVPDDFTWTIVFTGLDGTPGKQAALMLANPAVIGRLLSGTETLPGLIGSYEDFWKKEVPADPDSWALYAFGFGPNDPKGNFYAKVTAVPYHPELQITRTANDVVLSWPAVAYGYRLERNDNLAAGDNWQLVSSPPTIVSGINQVTQTIEGENTLYRLRHP